MDKNQTPTSEGFITTRQAAEILGVSLSTVQLWSESGLLKAWKTPGGHRRISTDSVEALRQQQLRALQGEEPPTREESQRGYLVLVVEDDEQQRTLYRRALSTLSVTVMTAIDGFEGLLKAGRYHPNLVISDLVMPGMDGFEMLRALSRAEEVVAQKIKIVVASALNGDEIAARGGLPAGIKVLQKPVDVHALVALVRADSASSPNAG